MADPSEPPAEVTLMLSVINDNERIKKTQIMYQAYLSYNLLIRYLNDIISAGLVICDKENFFRITKRGKDFLTRFHEYNKSRVVIERNLNYIKNQKSNLEKMCPDN